MKLHKTMAARVAGFKKSAQNDMLCRTMGTSLSYYRWRREGYL